MQAEFQGCHLSFEKGHARALVHFGCTASRQVVEEVVVDQISYQLLFGAFSLGIPEEIQVRRYMKPMQQQSCRGA